MQRLSFLQATVTHFLHFSLLWVSGRLTCSSFHPLKSPGLSWSSFRFPQGKGKLPGRVRGEIIENLQGTETSLEKNVSQEGSEIKQQDYYWNMAHLLCLDFGIFSVPDYMYTWDRTCCTCIHEIDYNVYIRTMVHYNIWILQHSTIHIHIYFVHVCGTWGSCCMSSNNNRGIACSHCLLHNGWEKAVHTMILLQTQAFIHIYCTTPIPVLGRSTLFYSWPLPSSLARLTASLLGQLGVFPIRAWNIDALIHLGTAGSHPHGACREWGGTHRSASTAAGAGLHPTGWGHWPFHLGAGA